jgi:hypothetical protein
MDSIHDIAFRVAKLMMIDKEVLNDRSEEYLNELAEFSLSRKVNLLLVDLVVEKKFHFDFMEIMSRKFEGDPMQFYRSEKYNLKIEHTDQQRELIGDYVKIYGTSYYGFGSMLSQSPGSKLFRGVKPAGLIQSTTLSPLNE